MSEYFKNGKGWRYDFTLKGTRYTGAWFRTRNEAKQAEARRKEEIRNPRPKEETPTDMGFLELVNRRLDHVKAYNSRRHYTDHIYLARKWAKEWQDLKCSEISREVVQTYLLQRAKVSAHAANRNLVYLKALFNFGIAQGWIIENPTKGIPRLPVERSLKYVPPLGDVLQVIQIADIDTQDYLWVIKETMGRVGEINRLAWTDVNFESKYVILYTRKKKGGDLTPRKVPMTSKLYEVLSGRFEGRDRRKPWVFWQRYWDRKTEQWVEGPYQDRKRIMATLCRRAGVPYFRFHALRHLGASILDRENANLGAIQRILGHENRTTTEIYLHSIDGAEREAIKLYERATTNSHTVSHTPKLYKGVARSRKSRNPLNLLARPG
jgi:integrase